MKRSARIVSWLVSACGVGAVVACVGVAPAPTPVPAAETVAGQLAQGPTGCDPETMLPVAPEDRPMPEGALVALLTTLVDRLEAAERAMGVVRDAGDLPSAGCGAAGTLDLLLGPRGRWASSTVLFPGALPADTPSLVDPGLALGAHDVSADDRIRDAARVLLGDIEAWRQPAARWNEIEQAVASGGGGGAAVGRLDGQLIRIVAAARLALAASSLDLARQHGGQGMEAATVSLRTAKEALAAACEGSEDPRCSWPI